MNIPVTVPTNSLPPFHTVNSYLSEAYFEKLAKDQDWNIVHATSAQDRLGWDFCISKNNTVFKVDVKCTKKIHRSDRSDQDQYIWIELSKGENKPGWLYKSQADIIAFETSKDFIIVYKQDLIKLVDKLVDRTDIVRNQEEAVYKVYQRKKRSGGGFEDLTLLESKRVRDIATDFWTKTELMKTMNQLQCDHIITSENSLHHEAIRSIQCHSARLREQKENEIRQTIEVFKYCPRCGSKIVG